MDQIFLIHSVCVSHSTQNVVAQLFVDGQEKERSGNSILQSFPRCSMSAFHYKWVFFFLTIIIATGISLLQGASKLDPLTTIKRERKPHALFHV